MGSESNESEQCSVGPFEHLKQRKANVRLKAFLALTNQSVSVIFKQNSHTTFVFTFQYLRKCVLDL